MNKPASYTVIALLMLFILPAAFTATITVKQDGSGDATTIQDAFNAAQDGDTIVIGDSNTYVEDITASPALASLGIPAAPLSSFTLKAADGMTPTIQAANLESSQRLSALGVPGKDLIGFVVWGCTDVTIQGLEIVSLDNEVNGYNVQSALVIADSQNVTVENCTFRGPNAQSGGEGNCVLIAGVQAQPYLTDNIVIRDCTIKESHYGIISAVFQKGSGIDPNRVTIENCRFIDGYESALDVDNAHQMTVRDCYFENYGRGIHLAGGNCLAEDCTILISKSYGIECDIDTNWNDKIDGGVFRRCAIVSSGMESDAAGVRCDDGTLLFENCIISGNSGAGVHLSTGSDTDVDATFDHCDVYENFGLAEVFVESDGDHGAKLTVKNCNIVSTGSGIENQLEVGAVTAHHNNVFVNGDDYINVNPTDSLSVDPLFVSPTFDPLLFVFENFDLQANSPVAKAGENGSAIGSTGTSETSVNHWQIF